MTDVAAPAPAAEGGAPAGAAAIEGAPHSGAAPTWMQALPPELQGDAQLARYPDVPALAKAAVDFRKLTASRVIVPGDGATDADRDAFYFAIGRPESADKYDIPVPEGQDAKLAEAFRPTAYKLGLTGAQAKGLAEWQNQQAAAAQAAWTEASQQELAALRREVPDYDAKLAQVKTLLPTLGVDPKAVEQIELRLGTGNMMKLFFGLAAKAGEAPRIDGAGGAQAGGDPNAELSAKYKDPTWRERAKLPGTVERQDYDRLVAAATAQEVARRKGA